MLKNIRKKFLILLLQVIKIFLSDKILMINIRAGKLKGKKWAFTAKSNNEMILGIWESEMQQVLFNYVKDKGVFYDLGAHHGYLSLLASLLVGSEGRVYSFEPFPPNFRLLQKNKKINNLQNCKLFNAAVFSHSGSKVFSNLANSDVGNTLMQNFQKLGEKLISVNTYSLDDLLELEEIKPPHFIKIDVEGAELEVLKGAQQIITKYKPIIYLETHENHVIGIEKACLEHLGAQGYQIVENWKGTHIMMSAYVLVAKA